MFKDAICTECFNKIKVSDEKEIAFCSDCGKEINSKKTINFYNAAIDRKSEITKEYLSVHTEVNYGAREVGYKGCFVDDELTSIINQHASRGWILLSTTSHAKVTTLGITSNEVILFFYREK